jgi:hypothetical protein
MIQVSYNFMSWLRSLSRTLKFKLIILFGVFIAFTATYKLLQKNEIYNPTIGQLTMNYERVNTNPTSVVREVNKPYANFIEQQACNWDAEHYKNIRDSMYAGSSVLIIYRYAFYPFFPMMWKLSHTNVHGIVFLNYLFYSLALILLTSIFLKGSKSELFYYSLALLIPTAIVFYLPYTESLFMLLFALAVIGLLKQKYWLFFLALLCLSMTRPSGLMLCVTFLVANTFLFIRQKQLARYFKDCLLIILPILLGWVIVAAIQYHYSSSWITYLRACSLWPKEPDLYKKVIDWSQEGFGMTTFAMFAFAIPAILCTIIWANKLLFSKEKETAISLFSGDETYIKKYLFHISMLFITGFALFNLLTSGYQWNGFYRYTMTTPFFYIILFQLPEKLKTIPLHYKLSAFFMMLICISIFLMSTEYAGDIFRFKYLGLYLLVAFALLLVFEPLFQDRWRIVVLILLLLPCLIWQTFLFNMFLGNAWVIT